MFFQTQKYFQEYSYNYIPYNNCLLVAASVKIQKRQHYNNTIKVAVITKQ